MMTRAKFMLTAHTEMAYGPDSWRGHEFKFSAQYDPTIPEDQRFAAASPSGSMTVQVDNPAVIEAWSPMLGKQFYLDLTSEDEANTPADPAPETMPQSDLPTQLDSEPDGTPNEPADDEDDNPAAESRREGNESVEEGNE